MVRSMVSLVLLCALGWARAESQIDLRGKVTIKDKGGKLAPDVADAVVWLEDVRGAKPAQVEIVTKNKVMIPSVVAVAPGSSVAFPNLDPFNHNVFSLSEEASFDLGLYGRGVSRSASFQKPGIIRVYCNVHPQMWAAVLVVDTPFLARPGSDGAFSLSNVPPGRYTLVAWHERGGRQSQAVTVAAGQPVDVSVVLDATGFKSRGHLNKFGKPYPTDGRRY